MADIKTLAVVPLEPTEAMLLAALQTIENRKKWGTKGHTVGQMLTEEWIAMIHAAPKSTLAEAHQAEVARLTRDSEGLAKDAARLDWMEQSPHSGFRIEYEGSHVGYSISSWDDVLLGGGYTIREAFDNARAALAGASGALAQTQEKTQ